MSGINYTFDATQYAPEQGGSAHPVGKFSATITGTAIQPTKDGTGGMFVAEYTTDQGKISHRFNLWNQSQRAVDIAHKQMSALCHAVGVFRVEMSNEGAALRGGRLVIEVGAQKGEEGYTEVKRVFDANGNEPGKPVPAGPPGGSPAVGAAPQQQPAPANAWGGAPTQPAPQQPAPAFAPQPAPAAGGWQQTAAPAAAPAGTPPWGAR